MPDPLLSPETMEAIVHAYHGAPFDVLGMHPYDGGLVVRAFLPQASKVSVVPADGKPKAMTRVHEDGLFEATFARKKTFFEYTLRITDQTGNVYTQHDPYRFAPVISDFDLHLFVEGTHYKLYNKLGAQVITHQGVAGVCFAVWAPNAERVSVVGEFNDWDGRRHPMRPRGTSGVWELFVPGIGNGAIYKFEIKTRYMGYMVLKTDPYGFFAELRPNTGSIVWDINQYSWGDHDWMEQRRQKQGFDAPISVYEVHLGSWARNPLEGNRFLTYRELANELIPYVQARGFTHIELLPVTEHPLDMSWGYQCTGYFAPTSRFGTPDDFMYFVDAAHRAGIGVIIDWVPAHFPKDQHGLGFFDGTHLYEHADPRRGEHPDWGTLIFNFGRTEVQSFLLNSALFWLDHYHIDGLRVDAVASMLYLDYSRKAGEWIPNQFGGRENLEAVAFLKRFNEQVHLQFPDVLTFAEESTAWPMVSRPTYLGGLGFDLKWNMGWMHDSLEYWSKNPVFRRYHHGTLTFSLLYAFTENFILPLSHDEVVHGKGSLLANMPGDYWQQFANLRALYAYMWAHPGKKLLFMGSEIGQWNEWNYAGSIEWDLLQFDSHRKLAECVSDLNRLYREEPALHQIDFDWRGFQWIDISDSDNSVLSFVRRGHTGAPIVVVLNLTPVPRYNYGVGAPEGGEWIEIFNSDSEHYGGSNLGNAGRVVAEPGQWQSQPFKLTLTLPPLGVIYLKPAGG